MLKLCQLKNTTPTTIAATAKCNIPDECNNCCWYITTEEFVAVEEKIERLRCESKLEK